MSRKATLYLDGTGFRIIEFQYRISKPTDYIGHPTGDPPTKSITMQVEDGNSQTLLNWAQSDTMLRNGHIFFILDMESGHHRTIYFMDGFCSNYTVVSSRDGNGPGIIEMKLIVEELSPRIPEGYSSIWTPEDEQQRMN